MAATRTPTPWAALAGAVRREIKARRSELGIPDGATVKVTSEGFSGGASVDVEIGGAHAWAWAGTTLTEQARSTGEQVAALILAERSKTDHGYIWGGVTYEATTIGSVAQQGWQPGQD